MKYINRNKINIQKEEEKNCEMLWIDKYQPRYLRDLKCNKELNSLLEKITSNSNGNIPHLLFYGPSGGGKKVRISSVLHEIFGDSVDKVSWEKL